MPQERSRPRDPFVGLRFWVEIDNVQVAGFSECSGLSIETETFEYAEGGLNTYTHKLPVRTKYGNITLKRGIDSGQDLFRWYVQTMDGRTDRSKRNLSIIVYSTEGNTEVKRWDLREAYPVKWVGPDLKTDAGAITVETLEIAHSGLNVSSSGR